LWQAFCYKGTGRKKGAGVKQPLKTAPTEVKQPPKKEKVHICTKMLQSAKK
jgi:hypothetical protein